MPLYAARAAAPFNSPPAPDLLQSNTSRPAEPRCPDQRSTAASCLPEPRDVLEMKMSALDVQRHLTEPLLDKRIALPLILRGVGMGIFERRFRPAQESRAIMRSKPGLPSFRQILAG